MQQLSFLSSLLRTSSIMIPRPAFAPSVPVLPNAPSCSRYVWQSYSTSPTPTRTAPRAALRPNIAIIGGGHAGISTALRLESMPWTRLTKPQITLIDRSDRFCFLPMLYELALGQVEEWEIAPRFDTLLEGTSIKFLHGNVETLNITDRAVEGSFISSSENNQSFSLQFDRAILATGAKVGRMPSVPGAEQFAIPFYNLIDGKRLAKELHTVRKNIKSGSVCNIIVVGGGFSGVEMASCLADQYGTSVSVLLIETSDKILRRATPHNQKVSQRALIENGVVVEYNSIVKEVTSDTVTIEKKKGDKIETLDYPANIVIWTAGNSPDVTSSVPDMTTDGFGRIETDAYLQVKDHEELLYALGDVSSAPTDDGYYGTAQVAVQQAEYASWNAWASITQKPKLEYRYTHLGEMMVLGESNASVTTSVGLELEGTPAWIARRVAYLARMPTDSHRLKVAGSWAAHPLLERAGNLAKESRRTGNRP